MNAPITFDLAQGTSCLCLGKETPRSLKDLESQGDLLRLECDLETLGLLGTALSNAIVSTRNAAAFITGNGGYGRFQTTAMPHHLSHKRINLRVAPDAPICAALCKPTLNGRQSLVIANKEGDIIHRIETADDFDKALLQSIDQTKVGWPEPEATQQDPSVISLSAVRCARQNWDEHDTGHHLNDIMKDRGFTRRMTLPHISPNKARPVLRQVLVSFLTYINKTGVRHVQQVPEYGLIQSALTHRAEVELLKNVIITRSGDQTLALDLDQIETVWVTCFGNLSQLEIYGHDGHTIAIFAADPNSDISRWNDLLASLPPPSHAI